MVGRSRVSLYAFMLKRPMATRRSYLPPFLIVHLDVKVNAIVDRGLLLALRKSWNEHSREVEFKWKDHGYHHPQKLSFQVSHSLRSQSKTTKHSIPATFDLHLLYHLTMTSCIFAENSSIIYYYPCIKQQVLSTLGSCRVLVFNCPPASCQNPVVQAELVLPVNLSRKALTMKIQREQLALCPRVDGFLERHKNEHGFGKSVKIRKQKRLSEKMC